MAENKENLNNENAENAELNNQTNAAVNTDIKKTEASAAEFDEFEEQVKKVQDPVAKLDLLKDLQVNVYIELGRTHMLIKDVLELERGYVIELDKLASEPVDVYVNNKKVAEGEVVVIDKHFGIRITNLNEESDSLKGLY